jgi:hypothetical protein
MDPGASVPTQRAARGPTAAVDAPAEVRLLTGLVPGFAVQCQSWTAFFKSRGEAPSTLADREPLAPEDLPALLVTLELVR